MLQPSEVLDRVLTEISTEHGTVVRLSDNEVTVAEGLIQKMMDRGHFSDDDEEILLDDIRAVAENDGEYFPEEDDEIVDLLGEVIDNGFHRGR